MSAYEPTEFARELRAHMEDWSAGARSRSPMWSRWTDGIHPDYRNLARELQVADEAKLHRYAAHLLSSKAFALNLFLPFREGSRKALSERVSRTLGARLLVDEVRFEWVPPGALLGELEGDRPTEDEPANAVDVVLWSRLEDGRSAAVFVEVKLSEDGFTTCMGRVSRWNRRQDVCGSTHLWRHDGLLPASSQGKAAGQAVLGDFYQESRQCPRCISRRCRRRTVSVRRQCAASDAKSRHRSGPGTGRHGRCRLVHAVRA